MTPSQKGRTFLRAIWNGTGKAQVLRASAAALLIILPISQARAKLLLSQKDALAMAFPGAKVEKKTAFLSKEQTLLAQKRARAKVDSSLWTYYIGRSTGGAVVGYAYFDTVIVRTLPAAIMAAVDPDGRLRFIEILAFNEPEDYLPRKRWLGLFQGRALDDELRLRGAIQGVSGATMTSYVVTQSARRLLAIHGVLHPEKPAASRAKETL